MTGNCQYLPVARRLHEQRKPCTNPATVVLGTAHVCASCRERALIDRQKAHARKYYGPVGNFTNGGVLHKPNGW